MGTAKTTIELNGHQYNAKTGELLDDVIRVKGAPKKKPTGRSVDGFLPGSKANQPVAAKAAPKPHQPHHVEHAVKALARHKPQHSKTLMRKSVKKPATDPVPYIKAKAGAIDRDNTHTGHTLAHPSIVIPDVINHDRVIRAKEVHKSSLVSKFPGASSGVIKRTAHLTVKPAPSTQTYLASPVIEKIESELDSFSNVFSEALKNADSHKAKRLKKPHSSSRIGKKLKISNRVVNVSASVLVVLVLAGFFAYQNIPNLTMRVAARKAGFNASLPGYSPAGFALNSRMVYGPGLVTVSFRSNSDSRAYNLTEQPSNWNSQTLLDRYVAINNDAYKVYEDRGKTIYLYGSSNAIWVNEGVRYQIEGNSGLSSDQLIKIANSL